MTPRQIALARHALGLTDTTQPKSPRENEMSDKKDYGADYDSAFDPKPDPSLDENGHLKPSYRINSAERVTAKNISVKPGQTLNISIPSRPRAGPTQVIADDGRVIVSAQARPTKDEP